MTHTIKRRDFPGGPVVKNSPSNAGDMGLIAGGGSKIQDHTCRGTTKPVCRNWRSPRATRKIPECCN